ncbi:4a-hydroxytetrahydrobiopterin dehydratase [Nocardioides sp. 1609]|uniref:4a-hydroxytetrahydrobiopterin dehydratase n=1 Tax=Nocardioides sp. 1609 TaxID=2508327 RepID=UPI00106F4263|nr:4a-hydroxytetrahydrobiopterin dehydratase [Nocardioides sp. 1609]
MSDDTSDTTDQTTTDPGEERTDTTLLSGHDVEAELLADWRILFSRLHGRFETGDFATGVKLVEGIGAAADEMDHHPDVDLTYPRVDVRLSSHDVGGVTMRDVRLARTITDLAGRLGATARPDEVSVLEVGLDTWDFAEVKPFWAALLGYESNDRFEDELVDPDGTMPTIWAQDAERHDRPQQRWHFDLRVPPEVAERRVKQAIEAGGTLVSDERAPAFWVLADAQGNQACITTWLGRNPA